jgi:hypothetical protein
MFAALKLLGPPLRGLGKALIELGTAILPNINQEGGDLVFIFSAVTATLATVIKIVTKVIRFLKPFAPLIQGIVIAFTTYKVAVLLATAAQWLLNVAMTANPVGLVIVAIGVLVGLIVLMVKHWKAVSSVMMVVWTWIKNNADMLAVFLGPLGFAVQLALMMYRNWSKVVNAFREGGIIEGLKAIGRAMLELILVPVAQLLALLAKIPGVTGNIAKGALGAVAGMSKAIGAELPPQVAKTLQAPNKKESETRQGQIKFQGRLDIRGAPTGSKFRGETKGAPPVSVNLGTNP